MPRKAKVEVIEDLREHVIRRPDTYVGSTDSTNEKTPFSEREMLVVKKNVVTKVSDIFVSPAFVRCIIEIGSNCIDNAWRSREAGIIPTYIKFTHDKKTGYMSFTNDGLALPIELFESNIKKLDGLYIPTIIFGTLLASTNFNDEEERMTSGRNGLGAKLTNIFSQHFIVESNNPVNKLHFKQEWRDNMSVVDDPVITKSKSKKPFTSITWLPDFAKLDVPRLTNGIISMITKYLYDIAMFTKLKTTINDVDVEIKSLADYAGKFCDEEYVFVKINTSDSEVVITDKTFPGKLAFTNGIPNKDLGVHVDVWSTAIFSSVAKKLAEIMNAKSPESNIKLDSRHISSRLSMFVSCTLANPKFGGQDKTKLSSPKPVITIEDQKQVDKAIDTILKWEVIQNLKKSIEDEHKVKLFKKITSTKVSITKYDKANISGPGKGGNSTIMLCEGSSAKNFITNGIIKGVFGYSGRDYIGVLPCTGKILNVRNCSIESALDNTVIIQLIQVLGLKLNVDYTDDKEFKKLNYGRFMVVTDADEDGVHIEGLAYNFFHYFFPSLLKRKTAFFTSMKTPVVIITSKGTKKNPSTEKIFYSLSTFKQYEREQNGKINGTVKYCKGLGSHEARDVKKYFAEKLVSYRYDEEDDDLSVLKAFDATLADERKDWIMNYVPDEGEDVYDGIAKNIHMNFTEFCDTKLINYNISNCERSLPNVVDGLKESQRKVLYTCFTKNLYNNKPDIKTAVLASHTSAETEYIHGDTCLVGTIYGMVWSFPGSNNLPLLHAGGACGSRNMNGKDAASARYTKTKLTEIAEYIFRKEDIPFLNYIVFEGKSIEPDYYVPIIPMILVNGSLGIGTGWSTDIPSYNPKDIIELLKNKILKKDIAFNEPKPYYKGFNGKIRLIKESDEKPRRYTTNGVVSKISISNKSFKYNISEVPIGKSIDQVKIMLTALEDEGVISGLINNSTESTANFTLTFIPTEDYTNEQFLSLFKSNVSTSNMVAFSYKKVITRYSVETIMLEFYKVRYRAYVHRKKCQLKVLSDKLEKLSSRHRFISCVIDNVFVIEKKPDAEILRILVEYNFPIIDNNHDYLLNIPYKKFTQSEVDKLKNEVDKLEEEIDTLSKTTVSELWIRELDELSAKL